MLWQNFDCRGWISLSVGEVTFHFLAPYILEVDDTLPEILRIMNEESAGESE